MPLLRNDFLQRLLTEVYRPEEMAEKLDYYGIRLPAPYFTAICLELDHLRGHTEQDVNLFLYAVLNISREIISHYSGGIAVRSKEDKIAIILNQGQETSNVRDLQGEAFRIAEEICEVAGRLLDITVTAGVGYCYKGMEHIRRSYREAMEALQYQIVQGGGKVIFIGQVAPDTSDYSYPFECEQMILTHLKMGNFKQVCALLDEFFKQLIHDGVKSYDHVRQSFVQLTAVSLRTLYEFDPHGGPSLFSYNVYQRLASFKTSEQIMNWLKGEVYPAILNHIAHRRNQRHRATIEEVLKYIHENYDKELSQPFLASLVSLPVTQFSHTFKEETGMTLTDYIIAYRMEKAKDLLANSNLKVSDIAERLQYQNSQNFIRVFKRITGLTPGEYRQRYCMKAESK